MSFEEAEWSDGEDENAHISIVVWFFNTSELFDSYRIVKVTLNSKKEFVARFKYTSSGTESTLTRSCADVVFYDKNEQEFAVDVLAIYDREIIEDLTIIKDFLSKSI